MSDTVGAAPVSTSPAVRSRQAEYGIWKQMRQKCENPRSAAYPRFGGRGVTICDRWRGPGGFDNFLTDLGPQPFPGAGPRLIDPDGDFEPANTKWADTRAQRTLSRGGRTQSVAAWARELGVSPSTLRARLRDGWTAEDVLTRGVRRKWPWS